MNTLLFDFGFSSAESELIFARAAKDGKHGISEMEFLTILLFHVKPAPAKRKRSVN